MDKNSLYRKIPKVDVLLESEAVRGMIERFGRKAVMEAIRAETDKLREYIRTCESEKAALSQIDLLSSRIETAVTAMYTPNMRKVINGTGTVLHTNLGRAPIGKKQIEGLLSLMGGYSNLEYDLENGGRGERYAHFEELLCKITGAEAAMAVNNNAAAVMLVLHSLAKGGEVIVSRGELVEIGGKFRIPDVMEQSGASLVEVGTTNKTHYRDYEAAVTEETRALLKVHTSNYRIVGFTETVDVERLAPLAREHGIPLIEDLGSGVLIDLSKFGIAYEPTVQDSIARGADVVCFSGDKLLGGPQAGIIIGRKKYIDIMKKNQLTRALRIDKFTAAALELVLMEYLSEEKAVKNIPVLRMVTRSQEEIRRDAGSLVRMLKRSRLPAKIELINCESQIGGGSLPLERLASAAAAIRPEKISVPELEERMRRLPVPIIPRIANDRVILDVRTIEKADFQLLARQLKELKVLEEAGVETDVKE